MTKVIFVEEGGTEHVVDAQDGRSVMQTALDNAIPGIVGECGGTCSCATCHGYVDRGWFDKVDPMSDDEQAMLEGALDVKPNSRLTCQIKVAPPLDGLIVRLPKSQQ